MLHHSELSEKENKDNEELNFIFDILANSITPKQGEVFKKFSLPKTILIIWCKIASTIWEQISLSGFLFITLTAVLARVSSKTTQPTFSTTIYFFIAIIFFLLYIVSSFIRVIHQWESPEKIILKDIDATRQETLFDRQIIKELSEKVKKENLKIAEGAFKILIDNRQSQVEIAASLSPVLSVIIVALFIFIFGIPIDLGNTLFYVAVTAIMGAVLKPTFDFIGKSALQPQLVKLKKCLFLLEQAESILNNIETNKNATQSKHHDKKPSLMSRLRNISIEGPEDFAVNHDLYISGEKRIEPDLR
jgi:hypothetical protein